MKDKFKSKNKIVQAVLHGLLYEKTVIQAIQPFWKEDGLFESPEANHIGQAALAFFDEYKEPMRDSSAWLDALAQKPTTNEAELESTDILWQETVRRNPKWTAAEVINKAEEYFEGVQLNRFAARLEELSDRGQYEKARNAIEKYKPLLLKSNGFLKAASEDDITIIKYLFKPFLAYGYITLLEGDSGTGKTTLLCDLISRLSNAWKMPPHDPEEAKGKKPKKVLYVTTEDGWRDLTLPRLKVAKADFDHVYPWPEDTGKPVFPRDIHLLENKIVQNKIKLVIFDPIISFMEDEYCDSNSASHVRRIMDSLNMLAQRQRVAFLAVRHFTKGKNSDKAMHRGAGSGAWTQACRFQFFTTKDKDNEGEYGLVPSKVNTVANPRKYALRYRIMSAALHTQHGTGHYGRIMWKELSDGDKKLSAEEWLDGNKRKSTIGRRRRRSG